MLDSELKKINTKLYITLTKISDLDPIIKSVINKSNTIIDLCNNLIAFAICNYDRREVEKEETKKALEALYDSMRKAHYSQKEKKLNEI